MAGFTGRPSASPVVAALFASGAITKSQRVLDVGCGDGTDCLAMLSWGIRRVVGLDADEEQILRAGRRANALGLRHRARLGGRRYEFHHGSITERHDCLVGLGTFDVVIDSLCWPNVVDGHPARNQHYARRLWELLDPEGAGLFVLQYRVDPTGSHFLDAEAPRRTLPRVFSKYFAMGPLLCCHLAEFPHRRGARGHAMIYLTVGRRKARPRRIR